MKRRWFEDRYTVTSVLGVLYDFAVLELIAAILFIYWLKGFSWQLPTISSSTWPHWSWSHAVFPVLVLIWGGFPYLFGAQSSLTMFSNLVTESERQNHLLINTDHTKIWDFEDDLVYVDNILTDVRPPSRYDLQGYYIPRSEFSYIASISNKDPQYRQSIEIKYQGRDELIKDLAQFEYALRPLSSYLFTFRQIDPYGVAKCRW